MNLPKNYIKSPQGQILVLFLLILVVSLAIIISISSRAITNVRLTTTTDESNRAYYAAEAAVEQALHEQHDFAHTGLPIAVKVNFDDIRTSAHAEEVGDGFAPNPFVFQGVVAKDDVVQANLLTNFYDLDSRSAVIGLVVYWGEVGAAEISAAEVSVVTYNGSAWGITKIALDPDTTRGTTTNFCRGSDVDTSPTTVEGRLFNYHAHIIFSGSESCNTLTVNPLNTSVLARVRTLYSQSPIAIEFTLPVGGAPPSQGTIIESTGETASGVTRKLRVEKLYPALPAIFDYVLFSGTDITK